MEPTDTIYVCECAICGADVVIEVDPRIDDGPEEMCVGIVCDECAAKIDAQQETDSE